MIKQIVVFIFLLFTGTTFGQKKIFDQNHAWVIYQGNHTLSKKWGVHTEYQWRRADFYQHWQQSLLRVGFDYHLNASTFVSTGYGKYYYVSIWRNAC